MVVGEQYHLCHSGRYHLQSGGLFGAWKRQEPGTKEGGDDGRLGPQNLLR